MSTLKYYDTGSSTWKLVAAGDIGATGSQGFTGPQGATGAGATGGTGATGVGTQGATGPTGAVGTQGFTGTAGTTGGTGSTGPTGSAGTQGFTGVAGTAGFTGVTGGTGVQGSTGATGSIGVQGFTGSAGAAGNTGVQGTTGPTGAVGTQGFTGVQGATGIQGTTGPTGAGSTGATGVAGGNGATGSTGPAGATGAGNVSGPASSVSGNLASFNTTSGKLIQDSGISSATLSSQISDLYASKVSTNTLVYNVKDFGAVGNDTADDTTTIQAALDAAIGAGGGIVFFPIGTYKITSALTIYQHQTIQGTAANSSVIKQYTNNTNAFHMTDGAYSSIKDLSIITNGITSTSNSAIRLDWSSNGNVEQIQLENILINGYYYGVYAETLITSNITNVETYGCTYGFYFNNGGTSTFINGTYANNCTYGYYLNGAVYMNFSATAGDANQQAYYMYNCSGIGFFAAGCESGNKQTAPLDGRGWFVDSCTDIGFYNCWNYASPSYALYITNSSKITAVGFTENGPVVGAINGIFIDTNCATVTLISPNTTSTNNTQSGGTITTILTDSGGNSTVPGTLTVGQFGPRIAIDGTSGELFLLANADASEYNLGVDTTGTLSLYGSAGATLHLNLYDGNLYTNGTERMSNAGTLMNTRVTKRVNSVTSSATPAINTDTTDLFVISALAANITSMTSSLTGTPNQGDELLILFEDNGTSRTITWGTSFKSSGVATLLAATTVSKKNWVKLMWDGTAWVCMAVDATGY